MSEPQDIGEFRPTDYVHQRDRQIKDYCVVFKMWRRGTETAGKQWMFRKSYDSLEKARQAAHSMTETHRDGHRFSDDRGKTWKFYDYAFGYGRFVRPTE